MGMGRAATGGFQNATNNVQSGMGGKGKGGGSSQPAYQPQGGFGGKGAGQYQPQVQQPQGGFGGKGGQQQQNPYAQQYYQPQFQPQTFNNPYAQGGFGQQPQMGGMGGKGGQLGMAGMSNLQRLAPNTQPYGGSYQEYASSPTQELKMSEEQWNAQQGGGMQVGIPEQQGGSYNRGNAPQYAQDLFRQLQGQQLGSGAQMGGFNQQPDASMAGQRPNISHALPSQPPQMGGMGGKGGQMPQYNPTANPLDGPQSRPPQQGGMGGKGGQMPRRDMGYGNGPGRRGMLGAYGNVLRGQPSGLAALQQPTATTQAASPAPEQPYMGNYMS